MYSVEELSVEELRKVFIKNNLHLKYVNHQFINKYNNKSYTYEWIDYMILTCDNLRRDLNNYCLNNYNIYQKKMGGKPSTKNSWQETAVERIDSKCLLLYIIYNPPILPKSINLKIIENYLESYIIWNKHSKKDYNERLLNSEINYYNLEKKKEILVNNFNKEIKEIKAIRSSVNLLNYCYISMKCDQCNDYCIICKGISTYSSKEVFCSECNDTCTLCGYKST